MLSQPKHVLNSYAAGMYYFQTNIGIDNWVLHVKLLSS